MEIRAEPPWPGGVHRPKKIKIKCGGGGPGAFPLFFFCCPNGPKVDFLSFLDHKKFRKIFKKTSKIFSKKLVFAIFRVR